MIIRFKAEKSKIKNNLKVVFLHKNLNNIGLL